MQFLLKPIKLNFIKQGLIMFIITTEGKQDFIPTGRKISGGQRSKITADIYKIKGKDGFWTIKDTRVLEEYLGYTGFNSLGINIGKFDIGYIDKDEDFAESMIFVCEYLEGTNEKPISANNKDISDYELNKIVPLVIASVILGDIDGTGKNNDNFLFELNNGVVEKLFKIDCGRSFEGLRQSDNSRTQSLDDILKSFLGDLGSFINDNINNPIFISEVNSFLKTINISNVKRNIENAYEAFGVHMRDLKYFNIIRRVGSKKIKAASDGAIILLTQPKFNKINDLTNAIESIFNLTVHEFNALTTKTELTQIETSIEPNNNEPKSSSEESPQQQTIAQSTAQHAPNINTTNRGSNNEQSSAIVVNISTKSKCSFFSCCGSKSEEKQPLIKNQQEAEYRVRSCVIV